ncbi:hypothetical protein, partial [Trichormus variabilis]|uniref:hypothetical protein n=1 Tax=Anabaena variabilis TaxID=264691 RepID=UPI001A912D57
LEMELIKLILKGKDVTKLGRKLGILLLRQHQKPVTSGSYNCCLKPQLHSTKSLSTQFIQTLKI